MKQDNKTIRGKFFSLLEGGWGEIACGENKTKPSKNIWLIKRRKLTRRRKIFWVIMKRVEEAPSVVISSRPDLNMQNVGGSDLLQIDSSVLPLRGTSGKSTTP